MLSTVTLIFWIVAGILAVAVCLYNADKTKGGKISGAFVLLGIGVAFIDLAAIVITFLAEKWGRFAAQLAHDIGFVMGFILILAAANKFRKAIMGE